MQRIWIWLFSGLMFALAACQSAGNEEYEKAAVAAADRFVEMIDSGQYDQTWELAAETFKKSGTKQEWLIMLNAVRRPLGRVLSRSLKLTEYRTRLPGAEPGEYVVVQYETEFENKKEITETITRMLEPDGQWRISGYYLE